MAAARFFISSNLEEVTMTDEAKAKQRQYMRDYMKAYREKNKEKIKEINKKYWEKKAKQEA